MSAIRWITLRRQDPHPDGSQLTHRVRKGEVVSQVGFHRPDERFVVGAHGSAPADLSFHSMLMRVAARATPTQYTAYFVLYAQGVTYGTTSGFLTPRGRWNGRQAGESII